MIGVNSKTKLPFLIASVYVKNNPDQNPTYDLNTPIGQHNSKHKRWRPTENAAGRKLSSFADNNGIDILTPPTATHFSKTTSSTIDFFLTKDFSYPYHIKSIPELSSEHNPVICSFETKKPIAEKFVYHKTNWDKLSQEFEKIDIPLDNITTPIQLNDAVTKLTKLITGAHSNSSTQYTASQKIYTPLLIRELITEKNRARQNWQTHRNPEDKKTMNRRKHELKKALRKETLIKK